MEVLYAVITCLVFMEPVLGYGRFRGLLPNGWDVPHPCPAQPGRSAVKWNAVGHMDVDYVPGKNLFGEDARTTKQGRNIRWNEWLCRQDSDGDGLTNGEELGDPNCVWRGGPAPGPVRGHPGFCEPGRSGCKSQQASHSECPFQGQFSGGRRGQVIPHQRAPPGSNDHPQTQLSKGVGFGHQGFGQPGAGQPRAAGAGQRGTVSGFGGGFGQPDVSSAGMAGTDGFGSGSMFPSSGGSGSRGSAMRGFGMALPGTSFPAMAGAGPTSSDSSAFWAQPGGAGMETSAGFDTFSATLQQPYLQGGAAGAVSMSGGTPPTGMFAETATNLGGPSSGMFMSGPPSSRMSAGGPPSGMFMSGPPSSGMSAGGPSSDMFMSGSPSSGMPAGATSPDMYMGRPSGMPMGGPASSQTFMGESPPMRMAGGGPEMFGGGAAAGPASGGMAGTFGGGHGGSRQAIERMVQERMRLARMGQRPFRGNIGSASGGVRIPIPSGMFASMGGMGGMGGMGRMGGPGGPGGPETPFFMGSRQFSTGGARTGVF